MKYARTKDGKIVKVNLEGDVFTSRYEIIGEPKDTIEELCGEYVIIYNKDIRFKKPFISVHDNLKNLLEEHSISKCKIYGAIWTEWGLKYVAKMNEEGKMELICD